MGQTVTRPGVDTAYCLTPWSPGTPPLTAVPIRRPRPHPLGWVPTRRQVLAGYTDPDLRVCVEGQVPRAIRELREQGDGPTVQDVARRLAIHPTDRDFVAALLGIEGLADEEGEVLASDACRFAIAGR